MDGGNIGIREDENLKGGLAGNLKTQQISEWSIQAVQTIEAADIQAIFDQKVCGISIPNFCEAAIAEKIANALLDDPSRSRYDVNWARKGDEGVKQEEFWKRKAQASDVDRVGPVTLTMSDYASPEDYSRAAVASIRKIRSYAHPYLSPMDRLRLELDEQLPGGARIASHVNGAKAFAGVGRVMESSQEMIHADTGRPGCLTANLYLRMPGAGGGTKVWYHPGDYLKSPGSYLFAPGEIPESAPCTLFQPTVGELVIWNPLSPHVVLPFQGGPRVSIQVWLKIMGSLSDGSLAVRLIS